MTWFDPAIGAIQHAELPTAPIAGPFDFTISEGVVTDESGAVVATATGTCLVFDVQP